jgi:hypothetical protein
MVCRGHHNTKPPEYVYTYTPTNTGDVVHRVRAGGSYICCWHAAMLDMPNSIDLFYKYVALDEVYFG